MKRSVVLLLVFAALGALSWLAEAQGVELELAGIGAMHLLVMVFAVLVGYELATLAAAASIHVRRGRPGEVGMLRGVLRVCAAVALLTILLGSLGVLRNVGTVLGAFAGLLLGWSLQAPVSGIAAWLLVCIRRPFRVGDRILLPAYGLIGDVEKVGVMYTVLGQVGGAVGSEEAVGRHILIPNAMLFSQLVINYTPVQQAEYTLDEVIVRITYDSDWDLAESLVLQSAKAVTSDIIAATGKEPYVRSDFYDYGAYIRLRYMTLATDRPRICHEITKLVFKQFQKSGRVDFAIPYVYSARKGVQFPTRYSPPEAPMKAIEVEMDRISVPEDQKLLIPEDELLELSRSIADSGLLQPLVVDEIEPGKYVLAAGPRRFEAVKRLGWQRVPVVIRKAGESTRGAEQ